MAAGVTPAAMSQYELGQSTPTGETLTRLAFALDVPVEFFSRQPRTSQHDPSAAHFRSLRATSQLERAQAVSYGELVWHTAEAFARWIRLPDIDVPDFTIDARASTADVEAAAAGTRAELGLDDEPIGHVVRLAESRGIVAVRTPDRLSHRVDAFSHWISGRPLMVLSSTKNDAARSRFDAAHEFGHLVMHRETHPGSAIAERQAHLFASCLLAPPDRLAQQLPPRVDWNRLGELKVEYGISLKSLAFAAHRLGLWSDATYRRAMTKYSQYGWGAGEPTEIGPAERPSLLGKAADLLLANGVPLDELAAVAGLPLDLLLEVVGSGRDHPRLEVTLEP